MTIAIYLGWIRHNKCGGVESFTRNLLDGFRAIKNEHTYYLICSSDNLETFTHYESDSRFHTIDGNFVTANLKKSIMFENLKLDRLVSKLNADICFVPTYRIPLLPKRNKYVAVIHDLQVCHFPENFSVFRRNWIKYGSKICAMTANKVVAISDFVRKDIIDKLHVNKDNIITIHNPILPSYVFEEFANIENDYHISSNGYLYSLSSMAKHKNVMVLLRLMKLIKESGRKDLPQKLVVSGIGLNSKDADNLDGNSVLAFMKECGVEDFVIFTGFVSDERRNSLIKNSAFFLFPSLFEGFGMPALEAMQFGAKVITTKCTSIPEATHNKALYVDDPHSEKEWLEKIIDNLDKKASPIKFESNDPLVVARKYLEVIDTVCKRK